MLSPPPFSLRNCITYFPFIDAVTLLKATFPKITSTRFYIEILQLKFQLPNFIHSFDLPKSISNLGILLHWKVLQSLVLLEMYNFKSNVIGHLRLD